MFGGSFEDVVDGDRLLDGVRTAWYPSGSERWDGAAEVGRDWVGWDVTRAPRIWPERYVDGSCRFALVGVVGHVPVVAGAVNALAGRLRGDGHFVVDRHETTRLGFAMPADHLEAARLHLPAHGWEAWPVEVPASGRILDDLQATLVRAQSVIQDAMRALEASVARSDEFTIVDGRADCLELGPIVGVVKHHTVMPLHAEAQNCVFRLRVGERSPASVLVRDGIELATWFMRIHQASGRVLGGVVRVEAPVALWGGPDSPGWSDWADGVSAALLDVRAARIGYPRMDCSLHPIVLAEDRLHAGLPETRVLVSRALHLLKAPV